MVKCRKLWIEEDLESALEAHANGVDIPRILENSTIPETTLRRKIKKLAADILDQKPGLAPFLGKAAEDDICAWALGMQRDGYPVSRDMLIAKGEEVYATIFGRTRASGIVGSGWCGRFLRRYPILTTRNVQYIKRVRNEISLFAVIAFFWRCARAIILYGLDADRIYNMDETGIVQTAKSRKVIAMKGSRNVCSRTVEASFHLTMVAAGSASGFLVPPLVIDYDRGGRVYDGAIMINWIEHFALSVPPEIKCPLMLVLDGAGSHMNEAIDQATADFGVILVQLPPNASHLFQPLDVAVFKGVKSVLKGAIYRCMIGTGLMSISKKDAVTLASEAWRKGLQDTPENLTARFKEASIWPINLGAMQEHLGKFRSNGIPKDVPEPVWLALREIIRAEILIYRRGRRRSSAAARLSTSSVACSPTTTSRRLTRRPTLAAVSGGRFNLEPQTSHDHKGAQQLWSTTVRCFDP